MRRQPRRRCRAKGARRASAVAGQGAEGSNRQGRERTASRTDPRLWQQRVRARQSQGERSPRCADRAGGGRFLATAARNIASHIAFSGADRSAQGAYVWAKVSSRGDRVPLHRLSRRYRRQGTQRVGPIRPPGVRGHARRIVARPPPRRGRAFLPSTRASGKGISSTFTRRGAGRALPPPRQRYLRTSGHRTYAPPGPGEQECSVLSAANRPERRKEARREAATGPPWRSPPSRLRVSL